MSAGFRTLAGAALELGHRYITQGVLMRHVPQMLSAPRDRSPQPVLLPFEDELRFAYMRFGRAWALWALTRAVLSGYVAAPTAVSAWQQVRRRAAAVPTTIFSEAEEQPTAARKAASVSVIVPTIDRYPYLRTLLFQLGEQTLAPAEILVVDQTPTDRRDTELYESFSSLPLKVIYQEQAGQCTSRNEALRESTGDYILFLDDDDEIPPDLIEKHLHNLDHHRADVSCGAADEVGAGPLPKNFTYRRASDVFPTNNSLIRRDILCDSGLFDLAYNTGQRADGDLGMRVYLSGKSAIYNPEISVLHHHAPRGGLRTHKARVITYASSRQKLLHRHLPSVSEIYLVKRYFTPRQVRESLWLRAVGTFAIRGGKMRKLLKLLISLVYLPHTLYEIRKRVKAAGRMLQEYPQIPTLLGDKREAQQAPSSCR
ncbi:MAG: glycosyltransferase family 2 protein [Chloroflexi bacterium]|nr:glycosyltransferase family 2 protein [Chloroflexota bacterium]